jgi:hypothetical protein
MTGSHSDTNQDRREDDLIPTPPCPRCGAGIVSTVTRTVRGVVLADSICVNGDPSFQKWVA